MSKPVDWPDGIPYIDTSVKHVGISSLRTMNERELRSMFGIYVLRTDEPIAVLMPYATFLKMQKTLLQEGNGEA